MRQNRLREYALHISISLKNTVDLLVNISFSYFIFIFNLRILWHKKSGSDAFASCRGFDAELVKIDFQNEIEYINDFLTTADEPWIGFAHIEEEGVWKWSDDTSLQE